jgi:pimeloyl-ACP methyl ester carboxylesterase
MNNYLLLHGSWHGAWCWFKVAPLLQKHGTVVVPNLPGRGRDPAWPHFVTLKRLVRSTAAHLTPNHPTTVVAHSRYGILATALAEAFPGLIRRVIYLASFMLPHGQRVADHFSKDSDSMIRPFVRVNRVGAWDSLSPEIYREGLYADCSEDDVALASSLLCREPSLPALARVRTTPERFGRVATAYIRLTQDRAVSPALQDRLIEASNPQRVESIEASHSAYFSCPERLANTILQLDR